MARPARKDKPKEAEVEANLIPVMSCMFLLIPALLLAMEVARHAAIPVNRPMFSDSTHTSDPPPNKVEKFSVRVRGDGFSTALGSVQPDVDIPLRSPEAFDYDFEALETKAAALASADHGQYTVHLSAEGDVPFDALVETMDALRGRDCSLAKAHAGERVGDGCYFWNVVIES